MEYETKTDLILPFSGEWMVSNGGRTEETNRHFRKDGPENQIYSYDFREEFTGTREKLEDYKVYRKEVLAPANAKVIQVIDGSYDMEPGQVDRSVGVGNAIIFDFGNGEYGLICHLSHKSIRVKVEDELKQGDVIALCGNSGNTSQPHIHFNLQDGPFMHNSKGLPAQFKKILVNGNIREKYEPVRFEKVSNV